VTATVPACRWALTLYVNGTSANSVRAIENARLFCDEDLGGHVDLEVLDVQQHSALAARDEIVAVPALVRHLPAPLRRVVGDLCDLARLRLEFGLGPVDASTRRMTAGG
jgi:circadian clock protein KaiB